MQSHHDPKEFVSHAPGYWSNKGISDSDWNDWTWQLRNRVTSLAQLEDCLGEIVADEGAIDRRRHAVGKQRTEDRHMRQ